MASRPQGSPMDIDRLTNQDSSEPLRQKQRGAIQLRPNLGPQVPRGGNYSRHASILLVGSTGVGKSTLGRIAAHAMGRTFINLDEHVDSILGGNSKARLEALTRSDRGTYYIQHLRSLLFQSPRHAIISCGNVVVDSSEFRTIIPSARSMHPIICILREDDVCLKYLAEEMTEVDQPSLRARLERIEDQAISVSSHCFFNLTCKNESGASETEPKADNPLFFKNTAKTFLRLVGKIYGPAERQNAGRDALYCPAIHSPLSRTFSSSRRFLPALPSYESAARSALESQQYMKHAILPRRANILDRSSLLTRRTMALSLTFSDLSNVPVELMEEVTVGVDAIELRADLLDCLSTLTRREREQRVQEAPCVRIKELIRQIETLRKLAPGLPIIFTIRSTREGGLFFDDRNLSARSTNSPHSQAIYFHLIEIAIATGVELVDIELGWDAYKTQLVIDARRQTKVIASCHDLMGALKWESHLPQQLYTRACSFGGVQVVQITSTSSRKNVGQNAYAAATVIKMLTDAAQDPHFALPPVMAINKGGSGKVTRIFNDVLSLTSHPKMGKTGSHEVTSKDLMDNIVNLDLIAKMQFHIFDPSNCANIYKSIFSAAFKECGLPFKVFSLTDMSDYFDVNQVEKITERAEEIRSEDFSDGLFLPGICNEQVDAYDALLARGPEAITWSARVAKRVNVIARQDVAPELLGTEKGSHPPSALADLRGPLIGCHTMPASIYRVLSDHLAPHNAPTAGSSALVVTLQDIDVKSSEMTNLAKRAAVYAVAKLGFRRVFVNEQESSSNDVEIGKKADWIQEISELVQGSPSDVFAPYTDCGNTSSLPVEPQEGQSILTLDRIEDVRHFCLPVSAATASIEHLRARQLAEPRDSLCQLPSALVLVGGCDEEQLKHIAHSKGCDSSSPPSADAFIPRQIWDNGRGGTLLRLPSRRNVPFGMRSKACKAQVEFAVERAGWIHIDPSVIERDQAQRDIFEAWTRRIAPAARMREAWQGATAKSND